MKIISCRENNGFTLVELMVALAISTLVASAIFLAYQSQQKVQRTQESVLQMQQNARAGMYLITKELHSAGYDPEGTSNAGIYLATETSIGFTQDITDDSGTSWKGDGDTGDSHEDIRLIFDNSSDDDDSCDAENPCLQIIEGAGADEQIFLDHVSHFQLRYTLNNGLVTATPTNEQLEEIEKIQVALLVRAAREDPKFYNTLSYDIPSPDILDISNSSDVAGEEIPAFKDNYRRRLVVTTVQCRNASL